jgi:hypothetical protein
MPFQHSVQKEQQVSCCSRQEATIVFRIHVPSKNTAAIKLERKKMFHSLDGGDIETLILIAKIVVGGIDQCGELNNQICP